MEKIVRRAYRLTGVVQGVGFRPHVAQVARKYPISGFCGNDDVSVFIQAQGDTEALDGFMREMLDTLPPLAYVADVLQQDIPVQAEDSGGDKAGGARFEIAASKRAAGARTLIPPDVTICEDCLADIQDPQNRRYGYAFATCTNCGPRLSIIKDLPYDRPLTTMADFPMCPQCQAEYADSADRRYHAQPISCYECGPHIWLVDAAEIAEPDPFAFFEKHNTQAELWDGSRGERTKKAQDDVLQKAREILRSGKILAVKGIGGFHLLADAANPAAVERLRIRKQRSDKPFAIMVSSLSQARQEVELTAEDERLLTSIAHPIVLSPRRTGGIVCRQAAPGLDSLGVMLAYTPLHVLLLAGFGPVVATSGNLSDEPLCYQNQDALSRLRLIADAFLLHNREIHVPVEDSVVHSGWKLRPVHTPVRRSRGYAPLPVVLHRPRQDSPQSRADTAPLSGCAEHSDSGLDSGLDLGSDLECAKKPAAAPQSRSPIVLAVGGELKNTFALVRENTAFMSAHIGDMGSFASQEAFAAAINQMLQIHRETPAVVVYDKHPNYATAGWARRYCAKLRAAGKPVREIALQHHRAHALSLAAEARIPHMIVACLDGTGFGDDGKIWGGEVIAVQGVETERIWHIPEFPLIGGDQAVKQPWRCGLGICREYGIDYAGTPLAQMETTPAGKLVISQLNSQIGTVRTTSLGRVFDAVAALVGITEANYEAQAAVAFQQLAVSYWQSQGCPDFADLVSAHSGFGGEDCGARAGAANLVGEFGGCGEFAESSLVSGDTAQEDFRKLIAKTAQMAREADLAAGAADFENAPADGKTDSAEKIAAAGKIAFSFHFELAKIFAGVLIAKSCQRGRIPVGISGGAALNQLFVQILSEMVKAAGLQFITHSIVPPNDGGLALGQAYYGLFFDGTLDETFDGTSNGDSSGNSENFSGEQDSQREIVPE